MELEKSSLVGTWQLESWTVAYGDRDDLSSPFGEDPKGLLLYGDDDWMSVSIGRDGREALPLDRPFRSIGDDALAEAYRSYFHYAGRYRMEAGNVTHYVTQSLNPNFVGSEQLRHVELDGSTLVLTGRDEVGGVTRFHTLVWHRLGPVSG